MNPLRRAADFLRDEGGPTAVEYAVMLALIVVVCIGALTLIGNKISSIFTNLDAGLPDGS
jgi:pilus assembly protein Flp/PilA